MAEPTDGNLITSIASGDTEAFGVFYRRFSPIVYNTALCYLENPTDTEEVTQDIFVKIWRNAAAFSGKSQVRTWVYRITVNTSLTALKKNKRHKVFGLFNLLTDPPDFHHPAAKMEEREENRAIFAAIYRLPDRQKTAFILSHVEGLPQREVAEIMGVSRKAVESLLIRAKTKLKILLANHPR